MAICLERSADLHNMAQLMPLPLAVSCLSKIQIGFTFLVPAHPSSPGQRAVKRGVCVCSINNAINAAGTHVLIDAVCKRLHCRSNGLRLPVHTNNCCFHARAPQNHLDRARSAANWR